MSTPYTGQCLCGEIKYEVDEIASQMAHCHCKMCQKFHGAAFSTFAEAKLEDFRWLTGESLLVSYQADNGTVRRFCKQCGSSMTFAASNDSGKLIEFALGTLDSHVSQHPDAHVHTASKAIWFEINDDLPQYSADRLKNHK